jgi:hypothetical protein
MATKELIERRKQGGLNVRRAERGRHWIIAWKGVQWIEHSPANVKRRLRAMLAID